jgi:hypothetical protein
VAPRPDPEGRELGEQRTLGGGGGRVDREGVAELVEERDARVGHLLG